MEVTAAMLIFGVLTVLAASAVVFATKPLNSALYLVLTLFLVAVHFALLGADFIAAMQVLIYAGAIMVLVIFVIMLLGLDSPLVRPKSITQLGFSFFTAGLFVVTVFGVVKYSPELHVLGGPLSKSNPFPSGSVEAVGAVLFTKYIFPFELASLLLLAAIIGAVLLASEKKRPLDKGRGLKAIQRLHHGEDV